MSKQKWQNMLQVDKWYGYNNVDTIQRIQTF